MEQNNNIVHQNVELDETIYNTDKIKNLIYNIRGKQVVLDSDVAMLYQLQKIVNLLILLNKLFNNNWSQFVTGQKKYKSKVPFLYFMI